MGRDAELAALMLLRPGQVFSGQLLNESTRTMTELFGSIGYAFANVNALPDIDREKRTVFFNVSIDPGRRVYVRRINISGNAKSRDEVVRRELRQFESAWYDTDKIRLSRERLVRLGYLTNVTIDTVPVPDAPDQVDLNVNVVERSTGTFMLGFGFSSADKIVLTASIVQQNWLGTGKSVGLALNTGRTQQTVDFNVTDPYFTPDGVSRSFNIFTRNVNAQALGLGDYQFRTSGFGLRFGVPYTELDRVSFGVVYERNDIQLGANPPPRMQQYVDDFGPRSWQILGVLGWLRDGRDNPLAPTRGLLMTSNLEVTLPVGNVHYTRADFAFQYYQPLARNYTLGLSGQIARGWALEGGAYPIFKNYFAGGINSVRGFETASLGPRDSLGNPTGGQSKLVGSVEFIFPLPGADQTIRGFTFVDGGNVWAESFDLGGLRYSTGVGLNWLSPLGPFKLSLGVPLNKQPGDRLQKFQFQIGSAF
jgi:outer membrane protein insertion porin family